MPERDLVGDQSSILQGNLLRSGANLILDIGPGKISTPDDKTVKIYETPSGDVIAVTPDRVIFSESSRTSIEDLLKRPDPLKDFRDM
ncbi:hypothetical protein A2771_00900 [Candidatus Woesebacteria bacterium RIFCSPHIGHO2_01_FULL_38_26b]|uniref:Uncharacterized protein n=1 Tax=Candidatus Woesebacteria bacterium RIFCSPHIGHO2_01_FULL_38_26b TaxID=1802491 RepID=A0A1F7Y2S9_9BACT|nr:MAG: hypothetical protein A2771_00900 [Candidatus Woesebacteria bacterium RIFCSPHIGHO2_01_FULL_38_26b]